MKLAMIEFPTEVGCEDITCIIYIHCTEVCKCNSIHARLKQIRNPPLFNLHISSAAITIKNHQNLRSSVANI
jgi:hypothetical protein